MEVEIEVIYGQEKDADLVEYFDSALEALSNIGENISEGYFIRAIDISMHYKRKGEF